MVKHKLMRTEPTTMAELMAIADKYATADSAMQKPIRLDASGKVIADAAAKKQPAEAVAGSSSRRHQQGHPNKERTSSWMAGMAPSRSPPSKENGWLQEAAGARRPEIGHGSPSLRSSRCSMHRASTTAARSRRATPPASAAGPSA